MCCFSMPVSSVSDTNIFARLTGQGTQWLAYSMRYTADTTGAMILPLPTPPKPPADAVRFVSLEDYDGLFDDLSRGFPPLPRPGLGCSGMEATSKAAGQLTVHEVGDYVASFVPTMDDFDRLDPRFVIPASQWNQIPQYHDYGFAVFQLAQHAGQPHPMAFEFQTRFANTVFFPTVHIHDGDVHPEEKFDHQLWLQHAEFDSVVSSYNGPFGRDAATGWVRSKESAASFANIDRSVGMVEPSLLVHRVVLKGTLANEDQLIPFTGDPRVPTWNFRLLTRYSPAVFAGAAVGWFLHRRHRLRKRTPPVASPSGRDDAAARAAP